MLTQRVLLPILAAAMMTGCMDAGAALPRFGDDVRKLSGGAFTVVLTDAQGQARVAVVPKLQGRVMTATSGGADGASTGTFAFDTVSQGGKKNLLITGGEERFTMGPEAGQFGLFFPGGADFTAQNYQPPAPLDSEPFDILERAADKVTLSRKFTLTNYSNKYFQLKVTRTVKLFSEKTAWKELGTGPVEGAAIVAYESSNTLANFSKTAWRKEEGLPSISTVHTVNAGAGAVAILPMTMMTMTRSEYAGPDFTADYGTPVPFDRVRELANAVILSAGATTHKIGIKPSRTTGVMGVYDPASHSLTIIQFMPITPGGQYTDAHWRIQRNPLAGDVAIASAGKNSIDLQTFSPALELAGWGEATHIARTYHITGKIETLDSVSRSVLGVSLIGLTK
jgi:hypothetical protein